jgi:multimeric flavodoxin WrbA
MNILVISSSPNIDGLTAQCAQAAMDGIREAGGWKEEIRLNDMKVGMCQACNDGWGTCYSEGECEVEDDFQGLHAKVRESEGLVLVTPVYYGDLSEAAKAFTDRLRRCEGPRGQNSVLAGKPILAIAAAGGSGRGTITCLASMERWADHVGAVVFDLIPVNRWNQPYKLVAIKSAVEAMIRKNAQY